MVKVEGGVIFGVTIQERTWSKYFGAQRAAPTNHQGNITQRKTPQYTSANPLPPPPASGTWKYYVFHHVKSARSQHTVSPQSARSQPTVSPQSAHSQLTVSSQSAHSQPTVSPQSAHSPLTPQSAHSQLTASPQSQVARQHTVSPQSAHSQHTVSRQSADRNNQPTNRTLPTHPPSPPLLSPPSLAPSSSSC